MSHLRKKHRKLLQEEEITPEQEDQEVVRGLVHSVNIPRFRYHLLRWIIRRHILFTEVEVGLEMGRAGPGFRLPLTQPYGPGLKFYRDLTSPGTRLRDGSGRDRLGSGGLGHLGLLGCEKAEPWPVGLG
jgi:hypothetical protein